MKIIIAILIFSPAILLAATAPKVPFSWEYVPVYAHLGNKPTGFTDSNIQFLASHFDFMCIEKGHGFDVYGSTEKGFKADAAKLKSANPSMKVIYYWNGYIAYTTYDEFKTFDSNTTWALHNKDGSLHLKDSTYKTYDLSVIKSRNWWTGAAGKSVTSLGSDGIFMDAIPQIYGSGNPTSLGTTKYNALIAALPTTISEAYGKMTDSSLIIYNGLRDGEGDELMPYTDGAKIEHFGYFTTTSKESIKNDLASMVKYGKQGKIVIFKAWPGFNWSEDSVGTLPYAQLEKHARERIDFPLACFLVSAQKYSYFCYTWGYRENHGTFIDYPELRRPLGAPQGDATITGWVYSRKFKHADVTVDIEKKTASITWALPPTGISSKKVRQVNSLANSLDILQINQTLYIKNTDMLSVNDLYLMNTLGKKVLKWVPQQKREFSLSLTGLASGSYQLSYKINSTAYKKTVVLR